MADFDLRIRIAAQDAASRVLKGLTGTVAKLGAAVALYFTGKGIGDFFTSAIQGAAAVEKEFQNLQSRTGAVGAELDALKKKADELGASDKLNVSALEAAQAMTELGAAGQSTGQILASIEPVITLAQGAQLGLADAAGIVTATLAQFGLAAEESGRVSDVLTLGANSARTTVSQLAEALSYTGLAAKESNMPLEQTVAILAMMQQAGVDGSRAGTALNSMLLDLANPASTASKVLDTLGIKTRDLGEIIAIAETKGESFRKTVALGFGKEAAGGFLAAVTAGSAKLKELESSFNTTSGAAGKAAETMNKGLSGAFDSLKSVWDGLKKSLGDEFLAPVEREVRSLASALSDFAKSPAFQALKTSFATVFTAAAANVREFISRIDFTSAGTSIVDFARTAQSSLKTFAETAKTNITAVWQALQVIGAAFSVAGASFSGGVAAIKAAFYGLGGVIDAVVAGAIKGFASLISAQAGLTFGPLRSWLNARVAELRSVADAFDQTATENFDKAGQSVEEAASKAAETRAAWRSLSDAMAGIKPAVTGASHAWRDHASAQDAAIEKSAELIKAEQDLAAITKEYQTALQASVTSGTDASATIALYSEQVAEAQAKVDALTTGQQANTQAVQTSTTSQTQAATATATLAQAQQAAATAQLAYQAALKSSASNADALGRAWQAAAANARALQTASTDSASGVDAAATATTQAATSAQDLSSAYQAANATSRAYNEAMRDGADDIGALKQAWMDAEKNLRTMQEAQRAGAQQTAEEASAWDAATKAAVTYGAEVQKSGETAMASAIEQRTLTTEVGLAAEQVLALRNAYEQASAPVPGGGVFDPDKAKELGQQLDAAKQRYAELNQELQQTSGQPTEVAVDDSQIDGAIQKAEALNQPTESLHTVTDNVDEVLSDLDKIDGADTSSTHTIYVQKVERNAAGGLIGLAQRFARGGAVFPRPSWRIVPGVGDQDTVPAALPAGAFVLRKAATNYYGSLLQRLNTGGFVNAMLTPGERVFTPAQVRRLGPGLLDLLNGISIPREALAARLDGLMSPVRRFAAGGLVGGSVAATSTSAETVNINLQVGNRAVQLSGARDQAASLASALRELQRGL